MSDSVPPRSSTEIVKVLRKHLKIGGHDAWEGHYYFVDGIDAAANELTGILGVAQEAGDCGEESSYKLRPTLETRVRAETRIPLIKIAAECHRRKWQFSTDDEVRLPAAEARGLVKSAFNALHNIGDMAHKAAEALRSDKSAPQSADVAYTAREPGFVKPDNDRQVFFYEQDFYVLSNFSAFNLEWEEKTFPTSEHAYHYSRFPVHGGWMYRAEILKARSAHDAFRYAQENKRWQRDNWDAIKVGVMRDILRAKANQHEYVRRKLLASGDRELIEDSWRDNFWGWGPNRDGQNMLGKLWMEVRAELRASSVSSTSGGTAA